MNNLRISNLRVRIDGKEILKGVDLSLSEGEIHILIGPNGSGKSTLAQMVAGNPGYLANRGSIKFFGKNLSKLSPDERAKMGIFVSFQSPIAIPGLPLFSLLFESFKAISNENKNISFEYFFRDQIIPGLKLLGLDQSFIDRSVNDGLSGGERKKSEILQMLVLNPKLTILDEIDSGLDIDAVKTVFSAIKKIKTKNPQMSILLITHNQNILRYINPDMAHIMNDGKIIISGGTELIRKTSEKGYKQE
ncbi:Fe-S cluster assembly ATPase SufC [Candidatus Microgenomates bacterium]|nr:Fe-S cluster assembly ATPase SufC [Candidatus Microgenomates bacterium]